MTGMISTTLDDWYTTPKPRHPTAPIADRHPAAERVTIVASEAAMTERDTPTEQQAAERIWLDPRNGKVLAAADALFDDIEYVRADIVADLLDDDPLGPAYQVQLAADVLAGEVPAKSIDVRALASHLGGLAYKLRAATARAESRTPGSGGAA